MLLARRVRWLKLSADAENDFNKRSGIDASERAQAKEYFKKQGDAYLKESGKDGKMTVGKFEKMKREKGHGKKWDQLEPNWKREADKSLSRAARRTVERSVPKEVKDLYNRANEKMERMINARKVMEKLDKKKGTKNKSMLKGAYSRRRKVCGTLHRRQDRRSAWGYFRFNGGRLYHARRGQEVR